MSRVIGIRIGNNRLPTLERAARALNRSTGEMAALLVEEGLRLREFPGIEFRDTPIGRQAFLAGTRLGIWQVVDIVQAVGGQADLLAEQFDLAPHQSNVALAYARAYPDEVAAAIEDSLALNRQIEELVARPAPRASSQ
jgi:uncharacterized protein (DUF433 family)